MITPTMHSRPTPPATAIVTISTFFSTTNTNKSRFDFLNYTVDHKRCATFDMIALAVKKLLKSVYICKSRVLEFVISDEDKEGDSKDLVSSK